MHSIDFEHVYKHKYTRLSLTFLTKKRLRFTCKISNTAKGITLEAHWCVETERHDPSLIKKVTHRIGIFNLRFQEPSSSVSS